MKSVFLRRTARAAVKLTVWLRGGLACGIAHGGTLVEYVNTEA